MRISCNRRVGAKASGGFSLLELIIVLTLLAIISAGVVPVFLGAVGSTEAEHATRDLAAWMRHASDRAITNATVYRIAIDMNDSSYMIFRDEHFSSDPARPSLVTAATIEEVRLPAGTTFTTQGDGDSRNTGRTYEIRFFPDGLSDPVNVELMSRDGVRFMITKNPTGSVSWDVKL